MNEERLLACLRLVRLLVVALLVIGGVATFLTGIERPVNYSGAMLASALALTGAGALLTVMIREHRPS